MTKSNFLGGGGLLIFFSKQKSSEIRKKGTRLVIYACKKRKSNLTFRDLTTQLMRCLGPKKQEIVMESGESKFI